MRTESYDFANILFAGPCNQHCPYCIGQQVDPALNQNNLDEFPLRNLAAFVALLRQHRVAEHLQDERISTELVDHLPASETVPTPLDFHGRIVGTPGELTYAADIHRYLRAIADASPRATAIWMAE